MKELIRIFENKLCKGGLAAPGDVMLGMADADICWNRPDPATKILTEVLSRLNINAILFARPAEPYRSIIDFLSPIGNSVIYPEDCETRTFLHDLPVAKTFSADEIVRHLMSRKSVIIPKTGVVTYGTVSPEQAVVTFSSVCFAAIVKFFSDFLQAAKTGNITSQQERVFESAAEDLWPAAAPEGDLAAGPFEDEASVRQAVIAAGREVVDLHLVDSSFGNVSYRAGGTLYISQTGSFLDDLEDCIDPCPVDGSRTTGLTASSELPAHMKIATETDYRAILHGHPVFSVICSMDCEFADCDRRGECHRACPRPRDIAGIPIVSGEVGSGPYGLCRTVPKMIEVKNGVIVYGHGVFAADRVDFNGALAGLVDIERQCRTTYFDRISSR